MEKNNNEKKKKSISEFIKEDRKKTTWEKWEGNTGEFLELVRKNPEIAQPSAARINSMITQKGVKEFFEELYGIDKVLQSIATWFKAAADRGELGKRLLLMVGPTSTGKSSIPRDYIIPTLEREGYFYSIKGCPCFDSPLNLVPRHLREELGKEYGIKIDDKADICFHCRQRLTEGDKLKEYHDEEGNVKQEFFNSKFEDSLDWPKIYENFKYRDENGNVVYERIPVIKLRYSKRGKRGISSFEPSDKKTQDISILVGQKQTSKIGIYDDDDARVYSLKDGLLPIANQGFFEGRELVRADPEILWAFISLCEEKELKTQEGSFPHIHLDIVLMGHCNTSQFKKFWSDKDNEALRSRFYVVKVPYIMELDAEQKVYEKFINSNPAFRDIHKAPYTIKIAALFSLMTRVKESNLCPDPMKKIRILNNESVIEDEGEPVDIEELKKEGQASEDITEHEGMTGADIRFTYGAIETGMTKNKKKGCFNAIDFFEALEEYFDHSTLLTIEEKKEFRQIPEKHLRAWYNEKVRQDVQESFIYGYGDIRKQLFDNYVRELKLWQRKGTFIDPDTRLKRGADEQFMREIEEGAGISEAGKDEFRRGILQQMAAYEKGEFTADTSARLSEGINKKLEWDVGDTAQYAIADEDPKDPEIAKRRKDALTALQRKGYCPICAAHALRYYYKIRQEEKA